MHEIEDRVLGRQPTVVGRAILFLAEIGPWLNRAYEQVSTHVDDAGGTLAGPPFARYTPLGGSGSVEIEAGFPVVDAIAGDGELLASHLPGGPAVATWHIGSYDTLESAYRDLSTWIAQRGARPNGAAWEVYHPAGSTAPELAQVRTEIVQPYLLD